MNGAAEGLCLSVPRWEPLPQACGLACVVDCVFIECTRCAAFLQVESFMQHASGQEVMAVRRALAAPLDAQQGQQEGQGQEEALDEDSGPAQGRLDEEWGSAQQVQQAFEQQQQPLGGLARGSPQPLYGAQHAAHTGAGIAAAMSAMTLGAPGSYEQPISPPPAEAPAAAKSYLPPGAGNGYGMAMASPTSTRGAAAATASPSGSPFAQQALLRSLQTAAAMIDGSPPSRSAVGSSSSAAGAGMLPAANSGASVAAAVLAIEVQNGQPGTPGSPARVPSDAQGQSRYLTVLVHRLQSKPNEEVLADLAAAASSLGTEAWDANFSKASGAAAPLLG